jgi:glycerol-3-phosphate dehydrogenase
MSILPSISSRRLTVVVIGGGATGIGIARDAAMRGFKVVLVERGELGSGTSGRFHGILHSGSRYVVNDPVTAADCFRENQILRKIIPSAVMDTGGIFLALNSEEASHADTLMRACQRAGIPATEIGIDQALTAEPHVAHTAKRAFTVPDGFVNGDTLLQLNKQAAVQAKVPATFLTRHGLEGFHISGGRITAVSVREVQTGVSESIQCDYVINAAGVWAGQVAQLASVPLAMIFDKGTMIDFKQKFAHAVLNRCRPEADGDLLVPHGPYSVMGTTARVMTDVNHCYPTQEEVDLLLEEGALMVPSLKGAEVARVYAGLRPLFDEASSRSDGTATRSVSRSFHILDHEDRGVENFISVVGGKVTLYRHMAEAAVDLLCAKSGSRQKGMTAEVTIGE